MRHFASWEKPELKGRHSLPSRKQGACRNRSPTPMTRMTFGIQLYEIKVASRGNRARKN